MGRQNNAFRDEQILSDLARGESPAALARRHGVSVKRIYNLRSDAAAGRGPAAAAAAERAAEEERAAAIAAAAAERERAAAEATAAAVAAELIERARAEGYTAGYTDGVDDGYRLYPMEKEAAEYKKNYHHSYDSKTNNRWAGEYNALVKGPLGELRERIEAGKSGKYVYSKPVSYKELNRHHRRR